MTIANDLSLVIGQRAEKVDRPVVTVSSETWLVDAARRGRTPTASNCSIGYVEGSPGLGRLLAGPSGRRASFLRRPDRERTRSRAHP